jgi:hypothetical protein
MQFGMTVRLFIGMVVAALSLWAQVTDAAQSASTTELARGKYIVGAWIAGTAHLARADRLRCVASV